MDLNNIQMHTSRGMSCTPDINEATGELFVDDVRYTEPGGEELWNDKFEQVSSEYEHTEEAEGFDPSDINNSPEELAAMSEQFHTTAVQYYESGNDAAGDIYSLTSQFVEQGMTVNEMVSNIRSHLTSQGFSDEDILNLYTQINNA